MGVHFWFMTLSDKRWMMSWVMNIYTTALSHGMWLLPIDTRKVHSRYCWLLHINSSLPMFVCRGFCGSTYKEYCRGFCGSTYKKYCRGFCASTYKEYCRDMDHFSHLRCRYKIINICLVLTKFEMFGWAIHLRTGHTVLLACKFYSCSSVNGAHCFGYFTSAGDASMFSVVLSK